MNTIALKEPLLAVVWMFPGELFTEEWHVDGEANAQAAAKVRCLLSTVLPEQGRTYYGGPRAVCGLRNFFFSTLPTSSPTVSLTQVE